MIDAIFQTFFQEFGQLQKYKDMPDQKLMDLNVREFIEVQIDDAKKIGKGKRLPGVPFRQQKKKGVKKTIKGKK